MKSVQIRFYEELNDFLPADFKKVRFTHKFFGNPSIKDIIESFGVPHPEVDLILVNGKPVDFSYNVNDNDDISVYPVFETFDIKDVQHLRPEPLRNPKFISDVHLGKLSKYLRMLGFDTLYNTNFTGEEIIKISLKEIRTILTRDTGILKRNEVTHAAYVYGTYPEEQLVNIIKRFDLKRIIKEFSRCLECNSLLSKIEKDKIADKIPPKVKTFQNEFYICNGCKKIYWKGSHFENMSKLIEKIKNTK